MLVRATASHPRLAALVIVQESKDQIRLPGQPVRPFLGFDLRFERHCQPRCCDDKIFGTTAWLLLSGGRLFAVLLHKVAPATKA